MVTARMKFKIEHLLSPDQMGSDLNVLSNIMQYLRLCDYSALECVNRNCRKLVRLVLAGIEKLPELTIIEHVDDSCQVSIFFEHFGVINCNDVVLRWLGSRFPSLTHVNLCGWTNISIEGVEFFASSCRRLKELDFSAEYRSPIKHIDTLVEVFARNCVDLELIYLKNSETMTDDALVSLGTYCFKLQTLVLFYCYDLGDRGMRKIYENCTNMIRLDVSHLDNISDELFRKMLLKWRRLENLYIIGCSNATETGFDVFASGCPALKLIDLSYTFEKLNGSNLLSMARGTPNLQVLNLCNCKSITDIILKEFIDLCPLIHTINLGDGEFDREPNITNRGIGVN